MRVVAALLSVGLILAACGQQSEETGQEDYTALCAGCHGSGGRGDGPLASGLSTPPADLTALAAGNGGTFPMLAVMARIDGYVSDTTSMPEFGSLLAGDTVLLETEPGVMTPTPARLIALAEYVESLQD